LVDEDEARFRFRDDAGQFAERLRHEPGLQAHLRFAHLTVDFGARHERGYRVHHDDVDATGADQDFDDLERLLAVVGLRHQEIVEIDPQLLRILRVERVLGVDERRHASQLLRLGNDLQRQRGFAGRLRPEDFDDPAPRDTANAKAIVEADGAGRDRRNHRDGVLLPEAHDRTLAELFLDLADGHLEGAGALAIVPIFNWGHNAPD